MLPREFLDLCTQGLTLEPGAVLVRRGRPPTSVAYADSGRISLGLMEDDRLAHALGTVQGPCWLEAGDAVLALPPLVDMVAETPVVVRRMALSSFRNWFAALPASARDVLHDVALAHRQQTELAVSRLAKDAEARCAEWLLRHAQTSAQGSVAVLLQQRKRLIAAQLGIAPETLSRVLRHLRERSLISGSGRIVKLDDPSALRSLAGV